MLVLNISVTLLPIWIMDILLDAYYFLVCNHLIMHVKSTDAKKCLQYRLIGY
jgi:hypothetical protein